MPKMPDYPLTLRDMAARARRLALEASDPVTQRQLQDYARVCETMAQEVEAAVELH